MGIIWKLNEISNYRLSYPPWFVDDGPLRNLWERRSNCHEYDLDGKLWVASRFHLDWLHQVVFTPPSQLRKPGFPHYGLLCCMRTCCVFPASSRQWECAQPAVWMTGRGTQICKTTLAGETGEYFHAQIPTNHGARRGNLLRLLRLSGQTQHASLHRQCQKSPDDVSTVQNRNQISESGDPVAIWGVAIHRLPARIFTASAASLRASRITSCDGDAATLRPMMQGPFSNMIKIW